MDKDEIFKYTHSNVSVLSTTKLQLSMIKIVCFILCDFYHNKIKKKKSNHLGSYDLSFSSFISSFP